MACAATIRSRRLATVRPSIPSPRNSDTPRGSDVAPRRRQVGERDAEEQAHQEAEGQADDRGDELGGRQVLDAARSATSPGTSVRYGRIAKPTTTQATTHAASRKPGIAASVNSPSPVRGEHQPDEPAERSTKETDIADQTADLGGCSRSSTAERPGRLVSLASPGTASPRARGPSPSPAAIASRSVATSMTRARARRRDDHRARPRHDRASRIRAARPRAVDARGRRPGAARRAVRPRRSRRSRRAPAGREATTPGRARPAGRARARPTREAAGQVRVDVVAGQPDAGAPPEHRDEQAEPVRVDAARLAGGRAVAGGRHQRLDLDEQRPAALHRRRDHAAGRRLGVIGEECAGRVGDLAQAVAGHLEHADLVRRPEPVLRRADAAGALRTAPLRASPQRRRGAPSSWARRSSPPSSRGRRARRRSPRPWRTP